MATGGTSQCGICLDQITNVKQKHVTVCEHTFHNQCLSRWLIEKSSCPCCRRNLGDGSNEVSEEQMTIEERLSERGSSTLFHLEGVDWNTDNDDRIHELARELALGIMNNMRPHNWRKRKREWTAKMRGSGGKQYLLRADVIEREESGAPPHMIFTEIHPISSTAKIESNKTLKNKLSTPAGQWRVNNKHGQRRTHSRWR
jgi:hypothetical protein